MRATARLAAMRPRRRFCLLALSIAAFFVGCGSDEEGTIPKPASDELIAHLDQVEAAIEEGDCEGAEANASLFAQRADELPADVDPEVKSALVEAGARLVELANDPDQCQPSGVTGVTGVQPPVEEVAPPPTTTPEETVTEPEEEEESEPERVRGREPGENQGGGGSGDEGGDGTGGTGAGGD